MTRRPCFRKHPVPQPDKCLYCKKLVTEEKYRKIWSQDPALELLPPLAPSEEKPTMPSFTRRVANYAKHVLKDAAAGFPRVTNAEKEKRLAICRNCPSKLYDGSHCLACGCPVEKKALSKIEVCPKGHWETNITWAYGVTTVKQRLNNLLPVTLRSLEKAGFTDPHLFVDDITPTEWVSRSDDLKYGRLTLRGMKIRPYGNWILAVAELFIRNPQVDRYALFQDDLIASKNLKEYLSRVSYPHHGYLNLYTFPKNETLANGRQGFYPSNQRGLGAVALVFDRDAIRMLLGNQYLIDRPLDERRGWKAIDGGVVSAFRKIGWQEYVHSPSLVQHIGDVSSMGNAKHPKATSFRGEEFDCLSLLNLPQEKPSAAT